MENRFFRRVIYRKNIDAFAQDGLFSGELENISLGGLYLKTSKNITPGEQIEIQIPLRNEFTKLNFSAKLTAIRREQKGIAFRFIELDPRNFWSLQSFIRSTG